MFSVYLSLAWASDGAATHASVKQVGPQNKKIDVDGKFKGTMSREKYIIYYINVHICNYRRGLTNNTTNNLKKKILRFI
jgi:hypothetical protein